MIDGPVWREVSERFPKKNILTPIGALSVLIFGTCASAAAWRWPSSFSWVLLTIGTLPLMTAIWAYVYFAVKDPDRLQTEDYRIQKEYVARVIGGVQASPEQLPDASMPLVSKTLEARKR